MLVYAEKHHSLFSNCFLISIFMEILYSSMVTSPERKWTHQNLTDLDLWCFLNILTITRRVQKVIEKSLSLVKSVDTLIYRGFIFHRGHEFLMSISLRFFWGGRDMVCPKIKDHNFLRLDLVRDTLPWNFGIPILNMKKRYLGIHLANHLWMDGGLMMSNHLSMAKKRNHHPICHFEFVDVSLVPSISTHENPPSLFFFDAASHVTQIFGEVAVSHGNTMQKRCGRSDPMVILVVFVGKPLVHFKRNKMVVHCKDFPGYSATCWAQDQEWFPLDCFFHWDTYIPLCRGIEKNLPQLGWLVCHTFKPISKYPSKEVKQQNR